MIKNKPNFKNQKGAALITVILITLVLLVACVGLLLESSMNSYNVSDSLSEQQAYGAAESGIQSVVNILRVKTSASVPVANRLTYYKAVNPSYSNAAGDSTTNARLSQWLTYNWDKDGNGVNDRITMPFGATYNEATGYAYEVIVDDPDDTGDSVTYTVEARINNQWVTGIYPSQTIDNMTFDFTPQDSDQTTGLAMTGGSANATLGTFSISVVNSALDAKLLADVPFDIVIRASAPYPVVQVIRGWFPADFDGKSLSTQTLYYKAKIYERMGWTFNLDNTSNVTSGTQIISYSRSYGAGSVGGTMNPFEPFRMRVTSIGYGPRGSKKVLEAIIQKNYLNNLSAPSPLLLLGELNGASSSVFAPGNSAVFEYSGADASKPGIVVPPIGTNDDAYLEVVENNFLTANNKHVKDNMIGSPANVSMELPPWLATPKDLDDAVTFYKGIAYVPDTITNTPDRYFAANEDPSNCLKKYDSSQPNGNYCYGNFNSGSGLTFLEGDHEISGGIEGGGVLICTGSLTITGGFDFKGIIIVTGTDGVIRKGGGNGLIQGSVIIAPYDLTTSTTKFKTPKYGLIGGGTSNLTFDSSVGSNGLDAVNNLVLGVVEK